MQTKDITIPIIVSIFVIVFAIVFVSKNSPQKKATQMPQEASPSSTDNIKMAAPQIDTPAKMPKYAAVIKTTVGDMTVELNDTQTPITVQNFVNLAQKSFYNNTIFHRVIKGFMIQGGDPTGTGSGGPGYKFKDEPFTGEYTRGTIAMANSGPNTNGSQFFIMHQTYALPKNYVIFGHVTSGLDALDKIAEAPVKMSASGEQSSPIEPVKILEVVITQQ